MERFHNVRAYQIELWEDCSNNCTFCYLNENRSRSTEFDRECYLDRALKLLDTIPSKYEAVGLIGGEFFQGQLSNETLKKKFKLLIDKLDSMIGNRLKQVWVTASLMTNDLKDLYYVFRDVEHIDDILICTSYDTEGRFKTLYQKEQWFNNIKELYNKGFKLHTQSIITNSFIEEVLNTNLLEDIVEYSMIDFKAPTIHRDTYYKVCFSNKRINYRDMFEASKDKFDNNFFIKDRSRFIEFLLKVKDILGETKIEAYCSNEVRSDEEVLMSKGIILTDRWSGGVENAPCGHPWDSYCYLNSDKCSRCDAKSLLDDYE